MVRKAVIPAAGFGTRFLPAAKSQPKEMLTIVDTPAIQYVVDNHLCSMCVEEGWTSACAAEWIVAETEKVDMCDNLGDLLEAAGYKRVDDEMRNSGE